MKATFALAVLTLFVSACSAEGDALQANVAESSATLSDTSAPATTVPVVESTSTSTETVEDVQPWPIGPMFRASEFELNGEVLRQPIWFVSSLSGSFDTSVGACGLGGHGEFEIVGNQLIVDSLAPQLFMMCPEVEAATLNGAETQMVASERAEALHTLFLSRPKIEVTVDSIILESKTTRLILKTDDPTDNLPVAPTDVWFRGITSTDTTINPERVSMIVRAFFVIDFQLETCLLHAQAGELEQVDRRDIVNYINLDDCPRPSESDQAVMDLLGSEPVLLYSDDQLTITGADGTIITLE